MLAKNALNFPHSNPHKYPLSLFSSLRAEKIQLPLQARGAKSRTQYTSVRPIYQNVPPQAALLNISPRGRNISHARSAYFTAPKARFHTAACRRISLAKPKPISQAASRKPRRFSRKILFGKHPLLLPRNRLSAAACRAARGGSSPLRRGICGESRPRRTPPFGKHKPQNQMVGTCSERGGAGLSSNRKAILARQDANL